MIFRKSWSLPLTLGGLLLIAAIASNGKGATQTLRDNTWVNMQAGGVAAGSGVGDEGFSTFVYSPGLRRAIVFGKYHARDLSSGEDQNALLGYDFASNRWDVLEITEGAWSEFLPGVGHDQGNVAVDPQRDLYIIHGNMTLFGNTNYQTYVFDLKAGRGRRMMPPGEPPLGHGIASAFDPDRGVMLSTGEQRTWAYDPASNHWSEVPGSPPGRRSPGLVYDTRHRVLIMFGGGGSNETWSFDASTGRWSKRTPAVAPPARNAPNVAFDRDNGIVLLVGGIGPGDKQINDTWAYDVARDTWQQLPAPAPPGTSSYSGNNLTYDSHNRVFLLKDVARIRNVWAFRYLPNR